MSTSQGESALCWDANHVRLPPLTAPSGRFHVDPMRLYRARCVEVVGQSDPWRHSRIVGPMVMWLAVAMMGSSVGCNMAATGQNMQGVRMYEQGAYYPAIERFQKAMATSPHDANAYYNMAATLHRLGTANKDAQAWQQAEALYNQCLDRDPDHAACHRALAVLLVETNRSDRAFTLLKNWAIRSPRNTDARVELARLHEEFGDARTAELQLQQALQLDQTNRRAWTALAHLRETKGDYQQALTNYQRLDA